MKSLSCVRLFVTPRTVAYQAFQSMGFSRQEYWSGLPFLSPEDLPNPGIEPGSPALEADALPSEPPGTPYWPLSAGQWRTDLHYCVSAIIDRLWSHPALSEEAESGGRQKALHICGSHIIVIVCFFVLVFLYMEDLLRPSPLKNN